MKYCSTCRTGTHDDARYCRSCYTIFPGRDGSSQDRERNNARTARLWLQIALVLLLGLGAGIWYIVDAWNEAPGDVQMAQPGTLGAGGPTGQAIGSGAARAEPGQPSEAPTPRNDLWGKPSNAVAAVAVEHDGDRCAISQAVHNGSARIIFPVELEFSFRDEAGRTIGDSVRSVVQAILPAGERRGFTFQLPCPKLFAEVNIAATSPRTGIAGSGTVQSVAELIAGKPLIDIHRPHLEITVPHGLPLCQDMAPCQLLLRFNDSWTVAWFRRNPRDPDTLISSDPRLIASLQSGWEADIQVPGGEGATKLKVTNAALRAPEPQGGWNGLIHSIKRMLAIGEG